MTDRIRQRMTLGIAGPTAGRPSWVEQPRSGMTAPGAVSPGTGSKLRCRGPGHSFYNPGSQNHDTGWVGTDETQSPSGFGCAEIFKQA
jgi:hypothetical protein